MIKKLTLIILFILSNLLTFNFSHAGESTAYFVRSSDIKTVGQGVKLYIGKKYIGKVWTNNYAVANTKTGKQKITTKVGLSIGVPVTGLGGAKKFKSKFEFTDDEHYFKIKFKMGKLLFPGQHEVIEISKNEYLSLKGTAKEIKYKDK
jgi:hypothetical protein|tara:strand:- start:383 stop:826 length:444 start_codon:yes stop_codon:yes gene_type:complete